MTTAIYVRVSDKDQKHRSQIPDLERWEAAHGKCEWFEDTFSGRSLSRPGWESLWEGVLKGRIKRIVVWRNDRLGRTMVGMSRLYKEFIERDVDYLSLTEGFDLKTISGRLVAHVMAASAEYETELRAERQRAGINAIKEKNGGRCPWGGGRVGVNKKRTLSMSAKVIKLLDAGWAINEVSRTLKMSTRTVNSIYNREQNRRLLVTI